MREKFSFEPLPTTESYSPIPAAKKRKQWLSPKSIILTLICIFSVLLSFSYLRGNGSKKVVAVIPKLSNGPEAKKVVYFNYFDSVVFLNDWKGAKVVVSKGTDDYIKQERLVIKSDGYYFNCYCKDLVTNYVVGDSIP